MQWIEGSKRLMLGTVLDHANSEPHKKAMDLHLKRLENSIIERSVKALETTKKVKENIILEISKALKTRLEESDDDNSMIIAKIIDSWISFKDDPELLDKEVEKLYDLYNITLRRAGYDGTINDLLEQWHITQYAVTYLSPTKVNYKVIWNQLFTCSRADEWKSILLLVELLFCLPVSNAKVERF